MSASLVGSEMCIRDRREPSHPEGETPEAKRERAERDVGGRKRPLRASPQQTRRGARRTRAEFGMPTHG
eukprot:15483192-Alexandrium_andersonii.AAC.1